MKRLMIELAISNCESEISRGSKILRVFTEPLSDKDSIDLLSLFVIDRADVCIPSQDADDNTRCEVAYSIAVTLCTLG